MRQRRHVLLLAMIASLLGCRYGCLAPRDPSHRRGQASDSRQIPEPTRSPTTFHGPRAVAVDRAGNVFVADTDNHLIRKISPSGAVSTVAGRAGEVGATDGPGARARFNEPGGIAVDRR